MKDRILVVDDDQTQCDLFEAALVRLGYAVTTTTSPRESLDILEREEIDVVVTDLGMGEMDGLELCERIMGARPSVPIIVVTGQGTMETAIAAMRSGAYDFLTKPVDSKVLTLSVARAAQHRRLNAEVTRLRHVVVSPPPETALVGDSPAMKRVIDLVSRVGATEASVLVHGETGTGKELVARALHASGPRKDGPFVAINCAAVPATLLESELFGHARGAFTDAKVQRHGLFVQASGGTLFLDEIGEMPLDMQAKLLRALQERRVRPVGATSEVEFDARIVAATHRDLEAEVDKRRFREDLFYRINVVTIAVPSLRERSGDIVRLASYFLQKFLLRSGRGPLSLSPRAAERMIEYGWPGNVRELENAMERAVALARFDQITVDDLPERIRAHRPDRFTLTTDEPSEVLSLRELERRYILRVIKLLGGNKSRAADLLGLDRRTLYRRLEGYERDVTSSEESGGLGAASSVDLLDADEFRTTAMDAERR